ncbi:hypothetical protein L7F22_054171 [Adiantum nelumboides]|nr:hypothetical protein [Adiantum nelumboides]
MALCPSCCRLQRSPTPCCDLSVKKGYAASGRRRTPSLAVRAEIGPSVPAAARNFALNAVAAPAERNQRCSKFADMFGSISLLYGEVGEEMRAAAECIQKTAEESGRSAEDYGRRALLFEQSGEMAASNKQKSDRVVEELELLQANILQCDGGRTAEDYLWRAELFSKSAEIFGSKGCEERQLS